MKILFILPSLAIGGLERVQVTLANALCKRGHDITIMTYEKGDELANELDARVNFIHKKARPHYLMKRIPYIRHKFYDDGQWETRATAKKLYKYYVGKEHYDVEIAFFRGMSIKVISGSTNKKSIKLAWVHNNFEKVTTYLNNFKSFEKVCNAYKKFNHVICVSNQAQVGFKKTIGETNNIMTIYNLLPVDDIKKMSLERVDNNLKYHKLNVILVGRLLDSAKGQIRAIKNIAKLHAENYDIGLTLVGDGKDKDIISRTILELNARDYIHMTGSTTNPYPYIKNADLLICASYFEGYNLTVAEALILGVPVLSTDCTGPNEILDYGKYGMVVENSDKGLYDGLKNLYDNYDLLKHYQNMATQRMHFFDEEIIIDKLTNVMLKLDNSRSDYA